MKCCAYCKRPATQTIVSNPPQVCLEHALEFWTGLLIYATDRPDRGVKHEPLCACQSCEELRASHVRDVAIAEADEELAASHLRAMAIAAAGPSPREQERLRFRLAS
jgi:hypothetical protein